MLDLGALASDPALRVEVTAGTAGFRHGATTVALKGSGELVVLGRRAAGEQRFERRLEAERLRQVATALGSLDLERRHPEPEATEPDDPLVQLTVSRDGEEVGRRWWAWSEREVEPGLDGLLAQWEALAHEASDGELPWQR